MSPLCQGDYEKAVKFFGQCYELCSQLNDPTALHQARVQYGIAHGHQQFKGYTGTVCSSSWDELERLIAWKDNRTAVKEDKEKEEGDETKEKDERKEEEDNQEEEEEEVEQEENTTADEELKSSTGTNDGNSNEVNV